MKTLEKEINGKMIQIDYSHMLSHGYGHKKCFGTAYEIGSKGRNILNIHFITNCMPFIDALNTDGDAFPTLGYDSLEEVQSAMLEYLFEQNKEEIKEWLTQELIED